MRLFVCALVVLASLSCSHKTPLLEAERGVVAARSFPPNLVLSNGRSERIYYFIVGRELSTLIDWALRCEESNSVAPFGSVSIKHENIYRLAHEQEVLIHWWHKNEIGASSQSERWGQFVVKL